MTTAGGPGGGSLQIFKLGFQRSHALTELNNFTILAGHHLVEAFDQVVLESQATFQFVDTVRA